MASHPPQWSFSGYNEIQDPKRKNGLIYYEKLRELLAIDSYDLLKKYHKGWVEEYLTNGNNSRDDKWTESIAVGSKGFIEEVSEMGDIVPKQLTNQEIGSIWLNTRCFIRLMRFTKI